MNKVTFCVVQILFRSGMKLGEEKGSLSNKISNNHLAILLPTSGTRSSIVVCASPLTALIMDQKSK